MKTISVHELHALLSRSPRTDLIDVRTPAEFAAVHVTTARCVPLDQIDNANIGTASDSPIYLICHSGSRAKTSAERLARRGIGNISVVEGGTEAWVNAGLPVERGSQRILPLDRQLQIAIGSLVLTGVLLAQFASPAWIWLAGFVGAGLVFAGVTGICLMRSLIARMPWNQAAADQSCCAVD